MIPTAANSERALILAPRGRDAAIAQALLSQINLECHVCADLDALCNELDVGAGLALISEEALRVAEIDQIAKWVDLQPEWSDFPFVFLTQHVEMQHHNPSSARAVQTLGNVSFLERPFHPGTLLSMAKSAIRGRRRQYQARASLASLSAGEENLQLALSAGHLGAWEFDLESMTLNPSARCKSNFGRSPEANFTHDDLIASIHPDDLASWQTASTQLIQKDSVGKIEYRAVWPDGSLHWIEVNARRVDSSAGQRLVGVTADITDRKDSERSLKEMNDRLEVRVQERTEALNLSNQKLIAEAAERENAQSQLRQSQKMEAIGQLTGGIAHDFNNLLAAIIGSLELIGRRVGEGRLGDVQRYVESAHSAASRGAGLTHRLLAFSRRQSLDAKPLNPNDLIRSMEDLLQRTLGGEVQLTSSLATDLWLINVDENQLENAILNLAINARDAMTDGGTLTLETSNCRPDTAFHRKLDRDEAGEYVVIAISDTGHGMTSDVLDKAFDPFFTTKPIGQGTGLGLSMIYGFAKQSGGHVRLYSEVGRGTTVKLFLPRIVAPILLEPIEEVAVPTPRAAGETILIVEDDEDIRMLVTEVLNELGYRTLQAADGPTALPILEKNQDINLLLTDVGLPGMNGRQLAEMARKSRPDLKVLFATGYAQSAAVRGGFLDSGMEMISKPFAFDALARKVRAILS